MLSQQAAQEENDYVHRRGSLLTSFTGGGGGGPPGRRGRAAAEEEDGGNGNGVERRVLQSNPILEAFGNARTLRNDNSSRFGKYVDMRFSPGGRLVGARVDVYLLERVRLLRPGTGERNYHVFYQLLAAQGRPKGAGEEGGGGQEELGLEGKGADDFALLGGTGVTGRRDGVADGDMHREMLAAMVRDEGGVGVSPRHAGAAERWQRLPSPQL